MFGRKHLERAVKAEARVEDLETRLAEAERLRDVFKSEMDRFRAQFAQETLRTSELIQKAHELDKKNAVLMERLDLVANYGIGVSKSSGPKVMPEEVEDALYQHRAGLIETSELEDLLAQAGFENAEIEFDAGDYPRTSTSQ
jgi:DNA gyrase/topoisomerase IV subunit A